MITLMTGGSACGKSSYAESLAVRLNGPRYYLAAMQPYGEGGAEKIARHRKRLSATVTMLHLRLKTRAEQRCLNAYATLPPTKCLTMRAR